MTYQDDSMNFEKLDLEEYSFSKPSSMGWSNKEYDKLINSLDDYITQSNQSHNTSTNENIALVELPIINRNYSQKPPLHADLTDISDSTIPLWDKNSQPPIFSKFVFPFKIGTKMNTKKLLKTLFTQQIQITVDEQVLNNLVKIVQK